MAVIFDRQAAFRFLPGRPSSHRLPKSSIRFVIVQAYVGTGNNDEAIAWLEKAYLQHSNNLTALNVEPVYDPLRGDPRFQNLLRRVGLSH
jgi:hypothetical protein